MCFVVVVVGSEFDKKTPGFVGSVVGGRRVRMGDKTRIAYVTDSVLLKELMASAVGFVKRYRVVVVDEVHERSMDTDLLLGMLKQRVASGDNIKIVVSSATLDVDKFRSYFARSGISVNTLQIRGSY